MRRGKRYACSKCGERSPHPVTCFRCEIPLVDEHGNLPPPLFFRRRVARPRSADSLTSSYVSLFVDRFKELSGEVVEMNRIRQARQALESAASGWNEAGHIDWLKASGQVRLLEPAKGGDIRVHETVACFRLREEIIERADDLLSPGKVIEERQGCGKFLITGGEHDVLVDEDFFQVVPPPGSNYRRAAVVLREGDWVQAFGPAEMRSGAELGLDGMMLGSTGYRSAQRVICYRGTSNTRISIQPLEP